MKPIPITQLKQNFTFTTQWLPRNNLYLQLDRSGSMERSLAG